MHWPAGGLPGGRNETSGWVGGRPRGWGCWGCQLKKKTVQVGTKKGGQGSRVAGYSRTPSHYNARRIGGAVCAAVGLVSRVAFSKQCGRSRLQGRTSGGSIRTSAPRSLARAKGPAAQAWGARCHRGQVGWRGCTGVGGLICGCGKAKLHSREIVVVGRGGLNRRRMWRPPGAASAARGDQRLARAGGQGACAPVAAECAAITQTAAATTKTLMQAVARTLIAAGRIGCARWVARST